VATSSPSGLELWVAAERLPELNAIHAQGVAFGDAVAPPSRAARTWTREEAMLEIVRGRLTIAGPTTAAALAASAGVSEADVDAALLALESEGVVLRGFFQPIEGSLESGGSPVRLEWCDRRLLARIHRYTLNRLRAEIEPVSPADFMRFLFAWQHVEPSARLEGLEGLRQIVTQLDGYEVSGKGWERCVLPARLERYDPSLLDMLCLTGEVGWGRLTPSGAAPPAVVGATPVALFLREHRDLWVGHDATEVLDRAAAPAETLSPVAQAVHEALRLRGASFLRELAGCAPDEWALLAALGELVAAGRATSDGFAGLRTIVRAASGRRPLRRAAAQAGRWSLLGAVSEAPVSRDEMIEGQARAVLRRYGVVFRRILVRETHLAPWRDLARAYRRLEARGEIRGGRFVSGMSGEQFALPEAVERLREVRRTPPDDRLLVISGADPLNLAGIVTSGERVRAVAAARVAYRNGVPVEAPPLASPRSRRPAGTLDHDALMLR
jgi:ATP-dependent Lhr-like helicase